MGGVFRRFATTAAGIALTLGVGIAGSSPAAAACDPAAADGVTATCSGTTNNQGGGAPGTSLGNHGYGTGAENNVTVNVLPGATVTGTNNGISLNNNAVIGNSGSITGGTFGIDATTITNLTNSGTIAGTDFGSAGIVADDTIGSLNNSGTITGDFFGITAASGTITSLSNSGTIGTDATSAGISANIITSLNNSGSITGSVFGISANTITSLSNSGSIVSTTDSGIGANTIQNLSNSGSITGGIDGINATGTITSLSNSGSITGGSSGISANTITSLGNSGAITGNSNGIIANTITSLSNSGSITGSTLNAGINAVTITGLGNSGSITGGLSGIHASNTITSLANSGSITGGGIGILAGIIQNLGNSGSIIGNTFEGINAVTITSLSNSGSITSGDIGILALTIQNLTNSGLISGGNFAILETTAADTQLTLLAGSVLVGQVNLGGGVNTLNAGKGLSMATTFVGAAPAIGAMNVPFVVNGTQVITADTTSLANHATGFADLTGGIFSTVENRIDHLRGGVSSFAQPMHMAHTADASASGPWAGFGAGGSGAGPRQLWMQMFGSLRQQEGTSTTLDSRMRTGGFVSGMDAALSATARAGVFVGASMSAAQADFNAGRTETDSFFGGAYASTEWGGTFIDLAFTAGHSGFDRERRIANNLVPGGIETAKADYRGWFVSPEVRFMRPLPLGALPLEASLTLRYAGLFLDGFSESGVTAGALTVGSRGIHLGIARAALSLPLTWSYSDGTVARWVLTGGVEGRTQFGGDDFSGTLADQYLAFSAGVKDTVGVFGAWRAELASPLGHTVFAAVEGLAEQDGSYQLFGKAGFRVRY